MSARLKRGIQAVLVCVVLLTELLPAFSDAPLTIVVVLSRDITPYRQALKGFEQVMKESGRGYKLHELVSEGSTADAAGLVGKVRAQRPDLILTIGSLATTTISDGIRDIPIVFSLVLPSSGNGALQGLSGARGNMTGASMEIPLKTQFAKMREVLPEATHIGVLYNPAVTGPLIDIAAETAKEMGLDLVAISVESEKDVLSSIDSLGDKVDVLWSVADSTVFSPKGLEHILLTTLRSRIPFVGLSPAFVKAGALLALSVDYQDVGRQSGEQSLRILSGEDPSHVPIAVPRNISLSVNMNTAMQIQVQIQEKVRRQAELFF
jgi:putative ABC transport system substrate-binding protein